MRALVLALLAGCSWSSFDDLADQTWAHSTQKPDIGSSDYATAIVGVTMGTSGGRLAVVGNSGPTYSTVHYDAHGATQIGPNPQKLGQHFISALAEQPILVTDGAGKVALVSAAIDAGNIAVVSGDADSVGDMPFPGPPPDAAVFVDTAGTLVIAAQNTLFVQTTGTPKQCTPADRNGTAVQIAAMQADSTTLWAWTKTGALFGYPIASLATCAAQPPTLAATIGPVTTSFAPGPDAQIHIVPGATATYAVLTGRVDKQVASSVFVVDLNTLALVGTPYTADELHSSMIVGNNGLFVALGYPNRIVDGKTCGQVELHAFDPTTGMMASAFTALNDAQPENSQLFGRALASMSFNGKEILVVAASNEVFSYYRTTLYPDAR